MTYRLNTDRLVFLSVLLWVLLPPGVFAWEGNPPSPDNVRWLEQFCSSYVQFLALGGVLCAVIGFVCAVLVWLVPSFMIRPLSHYLISQWVSHFLLA